MPIIASITYTNINLTTFCKHQKQKNKNLSSSLASSLRIVRAPLCGMSFTMLGSNDGELDGKEEVEHIRQ
jgi:hypothetical protein